MLNIRKGLLWYLIRPLLPITAAAAVVGCLYVLLLRDVLEWRNGWPLVFVLGHALWLSSLQRRFRMGSFAFLYTRGYSRDCLWAHTMLASLLAVLAVWAPAAIIVWTPIRGFVQDVLYSSPYFPIMQPREAVVPLAWLAEYCVLIPLCHYAWISRAQPVRGSSGGTFMAASVIVALAVLAMEGFYRPWFNFLAAAAGIVTVCVLLVASWRLHRRLEVQS